MKLEELIKLAEKHGACVPTLGQLEDYDTLEEAMQDEEAPGWAYWLRSNVKDLPEDIKRQAEQKACEDALRAYCLRLNVTDLSEEVKRQAEQKACEDPKLACWLRLEVTDLPEEVKRQAELKACESPEWAYRLRRFVKGLHPDTISKLHGTPRTDAAEESINQEIRETQDDTLAEGTAWEFARGLERKFEAAEAALDIIERVIAGEDPAFLANDYGGTGYEEHPAVQAVYRLLRRPEPQGSKEDVEEEPESRKELRVTGPFRDINMALCGERFHNSLWEFDQVLRRYAKYEHPEYKGEDIENLLYALRDELRECMDDQGVRFEE